MELKKGYGGFTLWMAVYTLLLLSISALPVEDEALMTRAVVVLTALAMVALAFIIWRTERVYWYSGLTYEDALEAGSERRKAFALRHLKVFGAFSAGIVACTALMHLLGAPVWIDIAAATAGLCGAAVWTMPIEL